MLRRLRSSRLEARGLSLGEKRMEGASIYILRCNDGTYYTGITRRSVDERVSEHRQGLVDSYTARRLPVEFIFDEYYERVDEAVAAERRIKGWSRAKKEAYMRGAFERLSALSKRKPKTPSS
jgi:putative endonuclease